MKKITLFCAISFFSVFYCSRICLAQQEEKLLFREDWKESPAEIPVNQDHLSQRDLILHLYGAAKDHLKKSNHPEIPNDPYYVWSGLCEGNWAMALSHGDFNLDLSGEGTVKWLSRQTGFRVLRVLLELSDGTWIVSEEGSGYTEDWEESEFLLNKITWRKLNMDGITEGARIDQPDLSVVKKVGVTDLMSGGGTPASSRLDWIAVYGKRAE
ncbi:MAG TPA: hypothetical protein VK957_15150 [Lunatimonas sp.]|nr:hypothetical protein [Lunatimonas sp.]